jgi:hypothetical protein
VVCFDGPRLRRRGASVASPFPTVSRLLGGLFLLWLLLIVTSELGLAYWRGLLADSVLWGLSSLSVLVPAFPWGAHCGARRWASPPGGGNEPSVLRPLPSPTRLSCGVVSARCGGPAQLSGGLSPCLPAVPCSPCLGVRPAPAGHAITGGNPPPPAPFARSLGLAPLRGSAPPLAAVACGLGFSTGLPG